MSAFGLIADMACDVRKCSIMGVTRSTRCLGLGSILSTNRDEGLDKTVACADRPVARRKVPNTGVDSYSDNGEFDEVVSNP